MGAGSIIGGVVAYIAILVIGGFLYDKLGIFFGFIVGFALWMAFLNYSKKQ